MKTNFFRIVLGLAIIASPAASIAAPGEFGTANVRLNDLDLSLATGRDRLETRIKSAAKKACGNFGNRTRQAIRAEQACINAAMKTAQDKVAKSGVSQ